MQRPAHRAGRFACFTNLPARRPGSWRPALSHLHVFSRPTSTEQGPSALSFQFHPLAARVVVRLHEIDMADAKRIGEMKDCHHGRVAPSPSPTCIWKQAACAIWSAGKLWHNLRQRIHVVPRRHLPSTRMPIQKLPARRRCRRHRAICSDLGGIRSGTFGDLSATARCRRRGCGMARGRAHCFAY
jgi:hypothetical protein